MAALQCDICGGSLTMDAGGEFASCESCGMKHDKRRMQQKVQEITGTVKIDGPVQVEGLANIENLLIRAKEFFEKDAVEKAKEYCEKILDIDTNNQDALELSENISFFKNCYDFISKVITHDGCYVLDSYNKIVARSKLPTELEKSFYKRGIKQCRDLAVEQAYGTAAKFLLIRNDIERAKIFMSYPFIFYSFYYSDTNSIDVISKILLNNDLLILFKNNCIKIDDLLKSCVKDECVPGVELALKCGANPNDSITTHGVGSFRVTPFVKYTKNAQIKGLLKQYGAKTGLFG